MQTLITRSSCQTLHTLHRLMICAPMFNTNSTIPFVLVLAARLGVGDQKHVSPLIAPQSLIDACTEVLSFGEQVRLTPGELSDLLTL